MAETADRQMTFWQHLDELRLVLFKICGVIVTLAIGYFIAMPWIFDHVITAPCNDSFPLYSILAFVRGDGTWAPDLSSGFSVQLINIELASQFMVHMSASLWAAFITAFPLIIYLAWTFVAPGLYPDERRGAKKAFFAGNAMFYLGTAIGYFLVFPLALRFLSDYHLSDKIANTVSLTSYMDTFYMILLVMGVLFELPLLAWLLGKIGIIDRSFFSKSRRYAIAIILVLAGILTPTSDIFTLFAVFLPVYALWECSALLIKKK